MLSTLETTGATGNALRGPHNRHSRYKPLGGPGTQAPLAVSEVAAPTGGGS